MSFVKYILLSCYSLTCISIVKCLYLQILFISFYTAMGSCLAVMNYESIVLEELSFQEGDKIEILGYFIECMEWFLGRHVFTGQIGFVKTGHVKLELSNNK